MHVIVTGCSSYIGGYIAANLSKTGFTVSGISRTEPSISHKNFRWIKADLRSSIDTSLFPVSPFIIHTAANSTLGLDAKEYAESNVLTSINTRRLAEELGTKEIIYTSSMMIYGETQGKISETSPITNPDPYGETKHTGENILNSSAVPCVSLRLCGVLGKGSDGWIASLCDKLKSGKKIEFFDSPFNNLIHVSDVAKIAEYFIQNPVKNNDAFNIAAAGMSTSAEIVTYLKERLGSNSELVKGKKDFPVIDASKLSAIYKTLTIKESLDEYLKDTGTACR